MLPLLLDHDDLDDDGEPVSRHDPGDRLPGDVLAWERYGVGHRCETWLAWSPALWAPVVVKFPRPHQVDHPRARDALRREVAALAGNLHPALPVMYVDGTSAAVPYLVFEHVDGLSIAEQLDEHGPFVRADTALLAAQLLAGLRVVHARGLAHVDVKPDNVILRDGRAVLLDFGSARPLGAPQRADALIGSPGYAAPDLEAGARISAAMDLYGLGATLYEMLTGEAAFDTEVSAVDRPRPAPLPPSPLAELVLRLLHPDPAERPDSDTALRTLGEITSAAGRAAWPSWAAHRL